MDKTIRSILILAVVIIGGLIFLGFLSNILSWIIPLAVAAAVGFILGRMSHRVDLISLITNRVTAEVSARAAAAVEKKVEQKAEKVQKTEQVAVHAAAMSQTRATDELKPVESEPEPQDESVPADDLEIKTQEDLSAISKRLEEEVAKRSADYDPRAAIEERKKRLLGGSDE